MTEAQLRRQLCLEKLARLAEPRGESTDVAVETLDRRIGLVDLQARGLFGVVLLGLVTVSTRSTQLLSVKSLIVVHTVFSCALFF